MNDQKLAAGKKLTEQVNAQRVSAGLAPLGKAPTLPDIPACDFCGKLYSANLVCSGCQCVFYCTPECQRAHWKQKQQQQDGSIGGHRAACKTMRETCEKMAKIAVDQMNNRAAFGLTRVDNTMLSTLDGTGAYRAAVAHGLNDAIRQLFMDDKAELIQRYANPNQSSPRFCYTNAIVSSLFRGRRMEGQGNYNSSFGCIDGQRIKSYLKSHPDAFYHWWEASLEIYKLPLDDDVWKLGKDCHFMAHVCARDVWAAWSLVLVDKCACRAIFLPTTTTTTTTGSASASASANNTTSDTSTSDARAKYLITTLQKILARRWSVNDNRDNGSVLEGLLNQVAALIYHRLVEFKIPPFTGNNSNQTFIKLLKLKGIHKKMYEDMAVPVAKAMIIKGGTLTNDEYQKNVRRPPGHN